MQVEQDMVGKLASTLYQVMQGGAPEVAFDALPEDRREPYHEAVEMLIAELSGHVAALVKGIGDVALEQERRARRYHADYMKAITDKGHAEDLLRMALPFILAAKWRYEEGASELLTKAQKALVEAGMELDSEGL